MEVMESPIQRADSKSSYLDNSMQIPEKVTQTAAMKYSSSIPWLVSYS